jgi:polyhydroxybutyrate depolymerase
MDLETVARRARRGFFALVGLIQTALLAGCGSNTVESVHVEPLFQRGYRVVKRSDHDARKPAPVLFALHPYGTPTSILVDALALSRHAAGSRGYVLVVPEGTRDAEGQPFWNASAACCGAGAQRPDDIGYLKSVLDDVKRQLAVDPERVFAIGASNGGFMVHRWACDPRGDLRGIVSIAGAGQGPDDPPCAARRPLNVLQIHGTSDDTVRFEGGRGVGGGVPSGRYPSAQDTTLAWARVAGSAADPERNERYVFRLGTLRQAKWTNRGVTAALWTVEQGDHELKGVARLTAELLDFLEGT